MGKMEDLGAVETALKNATEASLAKIHTGLNRFEFVGSNIFHVGHVGLQSLRSLSGEIFRRSLTTNE